MPDDIATREQLLRHLSHLLHRYRDELVRIDRELSPQITDVANALHRLPARNERR